MTDADTPAHSTIVVGVDASEPSKDALRWAARQAELTGADLRVVMSWEIPTAAYWAPVPDDWDFEEATSEALEVTVRETLGDPLPVKVTAVVARGRPGLALLEQARDADLLVVGSRGHGGFTGMLLGSVSEHCVAHSVCPVVVVHHSEREG